MTSGRTNIFFSCINGSKFTQKLSVTNEKAIKKTLYCHTFLNNYNFNLPTSVPNVGYLKNKKSFPKPFRSPRPIWLWLRDLWNYGSLNARTIASVPCVSVELNRHEILLLLSLSLMFMIRNQKIPSLLFIIKESYQPVSYVVLNIARRGQNLSRKRSKKLVNVLGNTSMWNDKKVVSKGIADLKYFLTTIVLNWATGK